MEDAELFEVLVSKTGDGFFYIGERFSLHCSGFGVEFIGVTNELFEYGFGDEFANAHSGMAFGYSCRPFRRAFSSEQFCSERSMFDIRVGSVAVNVGSGGQEDSDVVEHGSRLYLQSVKLRCMGCSEFFS